MSDTITKDELNASIQTQVKATEQLVIIAERLKAICEDQEKIKNRLYNGMAKDIAENFSRSTKDNFDLMYKELKTKQDEIKKCSDETREDAKFAKWTFGIMAVVMAICTLVFQFNGVPVRQTEQKQVHYSQAQTVQP